MSILVIVLISIAIILVLLVGSILIYNNLVSIKNQVENAWKQIDVQLKRRHDLIPNLVNSTKDYMKYEKETLTAVVNARAQAVNSQGVEQSVKAEGKLTGALGRLLAVIENYPDLKAQQNVAQLMEELRGTENKISFSRQFYNDSVMTLNNKVQSFPSNIVASLFGFKAGTYFNIPDEEKSVPNVNLNN